MQKIEISDLEERTGDNMSKAKKRKTENRKTKGLKRCNIAGRKKGQIDFKAEKIQDSNTEMKWNDFD